MLLVTNPCCILDYWDVSISISTIKYPGTVNGYKCWNLELYKKSYHHHHDEMILVLATFTISVLLYFSTIKVEYSFTKDYEC